MDGALRVLTKIELAGKPAKKLVEVYLWQSGMHKSLAELRAESYALYSNLTRENAVPIILQFKCSTFRFKSNTALLQGLPARVSRLANTRS